MTVIASGLNTFHPPSFARSRLGDTLMVTGVDRGRRDDGLKEAMDLLGIDAPATAPVIASSGVGTITGTYVFAYRFVESRAQSSLNLYSNGSPRTTIAPVTNVSTFTWGVATPMSTTAQSRVTHVEFLRSTGDQSTVLYREITFGAQGAITSAADNAGTYRFTVPTGHNLGLGARITIAGATGAGAGAVNATHTVTGGTATTVNVSTAYAGDTTGGTWLLTGYSGASLQDTTISDETFALFLKVPVVNDNGTPNLYSHYPPPDYMGHVDFFQDRALYMAPVVYTAGTIAVTNGIATVTGTGTAFTSQMAGRLFTKLGDVRSYLIGSVDVGAQTLTLSEVYAGSNSSGSSYDVSIDPIEFERIYNSEIDRGESLTLETIDVQENTRDNDRIVGGWPFASVYYIFKERHIYELTWEVQPIFDHNTRLVAFRGAINKRCMDALEGLVYAMDQFGCYTINAAGQVKPISGPIQDLFRDGTIDFSQKAHFHVGADPCSEFVDFFVALTGDGTGRPKRWLRYMVRTGAWWTGSGVHRIGATCRADVGGANRVLWGGEDDQIYLAGEGTTDHVTSGTRVTVTGGTSTTITYAATGAVSADAFKHAPLAIIDGTGARQLRKITANTSVGGGGGTVTITVDPAWTITPVANDIALIGAVELTYRSKDFGFPTGEETENETRRRLDILAQPTIGDAEIRVRAYWDYAAGAAAYEHGLMSGIHVRIVEGTPDMEVNLRAVSSTGEGRWSGLARFDFSGASDSRGESRRSVAFELKAYQGSEMIIVDELTVAGAK